MLRTAAEIGDLADFLQRLGIRTMIIGVIRRADYLLPSAYAEAVRSGSTTRLRPPFVERRAHLLDHRLLLEQWSAAFEEIRLIPYLETDKSDPAAVPRRFLQACGVSATATADWPQSDRLSRPGLSATAVEVLRRISPTLGLAQWQSGAERNRLIEFLAARHPGQGVRLTSSARRALDEHGWIQTGIDTSPAAYGSGWQDWRDTEAAPMAPPAQPSDELVAETLRAATAAGFGHRPIAGRALGLLRRLRR